MIAYAGFVVRQLALPPTSFGGRAFEPVSDFTTFEHLLSSCMDGLPYIDLNLVLKSHFAEHSVSQGRLPNGCSANAGISIAN